MTRSSLVFMLVAGVALVYLAMYRAWTSRIAGQREIAAPRPADSGATPLAGPWVGRYLGAVFADQWLERIAVHTLGERSTTSVMLTQADITVLRPDALSFSIPKSDVIAVRADKAIAGRAYEDGGIVVITFRLGDTAVDIGFRFPDTEDHLAALAALAPEVTS